MVRQELRREGGDADCVIWVPRDTSGGFQIDVSNIAVELKRFSLQSAALWLHSQKLCSCSFLQMLFDPFFPVSPLFIVSTFASVYFFFFFNFLSTTLRFFACRGWSIKDKPCWNYWTAEDLKWKFYGCKYLMCKVFRSCSGHSLCFTVITA